MAAPYGVGFYRDIVLAQETTYGVQAAGPGQLLRRSNFSGELQQQQIASQEIGLNAQVRNAGLTAPGSSLSLSGELSPGSYKALFASVLRGTWAAPITTGVESTTALAIAGGTGVLTLTYGGTGNSYLTDGFKKGDVCRFSGITSTASALNGVNLLCTAVSAPTISFAPVATAVAWTAGTQSAVTLTTAGKKLMIPTRASQGQIFFTVEDWQADKSLSRMFLGNTVGQISMSVQPNGYVAFQAALTGKKVVAAGAQVYASPTAASTTAPCQGVSGRLLYGGTPMGIITSFSLQIMQALQPVPVVDGADGPPMIAGGQIGVQASFQAILDDDTFTADFLAQNDLDVSFHLPTSGLGTADFVNIFLPRGRLSSPGNRQDTDRAMIRSFTVLGMEKTAGGSGTAYDATSIVIQDSQA